MNRTPSFLASLLALAPLAAQGTLVSPAHYATEEGFSANGTPFSLATFPIRHQQAHGDLRGTPRVIRSIAFRRDGRTTTSTTWAPRTLDLTVRCAHTNFTALSATLASNYATPPVTAMTRRSFTTPDLQPVMRTVPAPFTFVLPLDQPFAFNGTLDLLWETEAFGATGSGTQTPLDLCNSGFNLVIPGGYAMNGTGCLVPFNGGQELALRSSISLQGFPVDAWILAFTATSCPPSAAGVFMMGASDPDLALPGLCANLRVLPLVSLPGTTDATGTWTPLAPITPSPRIPYQAGAVGATFTSQVAVLDPARPDALKVAMSNGLASRLPAQTPTVAIGRAYEIGTTTGTGTLATGTGLVTRFGL
jgi:hypothetical protein